MAARERLDRLLVELGLCESRERARALILAGKVRVDDRVADKAGAQIARDARVELVGTPEHDYVSRGALKLLGALERFDVPIAGRVALDLGASTGGFTDVLLRRGATRVYAVDVGYGQLHWRLRQDPRVVVLERINARQLGAAEIPEPVGVMTADLSFISLTLVLPAAAPLLASGARAVLLVKPQFEAGREAVGKGGVVRDESDRQAAVERVRACCEQLGLTVEGVVPSPILGPAGNQEYLLVARRPEQAPD